MQNKLDLNEEPYILRDIAHIHFPKLKSLSLSDNRIHSIEGLCRIRMPFLNELYLSPSSHYTGYNNINIIKELRKSSFKVRLISISSHLNHLGDNAIGECPWLSEMLFTEEAQIFFSEKDKIPNDNLKVLAKMQASSLSSLGSALLM